MIHDFISTIFTPASGLNVLSDVEKNLRKQFPTQEIGTKFLPQQKPPDENPLRCRGSGTSTARNAAPCQARQISEKWFHFEVSGVDDEKSWIHDEIAWHSFSQVVKFYGNAFFCNIHLYFDLWDKPDRVTVKHMSHMFFLGDYIWISKRSPRLPSSLTLWNWQLTGFGSQNRPEGGAPRKNTAPNSSFCRCFSS